jgi:hypothetical protein
MLEENEKLEASVQKIVFFKNAKFIQKISVRLNK